MYIPIPPRKPGDPPPPPLRVQALYLIAFFAILVLVIGAAVGLRGRF